MEIARTILDELLNVVFAENASLSVEQRNQVRGICQDALSYALHVTSPQASEGERVLARSRLAEDKTHRFDLSTAEARESTYWRLTAAEVEIVASNLAGKDEAVDQALKQAIELFLKEAAIDEDMF